MGRDVGRDEGRDQAAWRDLVTRLELMPTIDPADAPWPDRENLPAKPATSATRQSESGDLVPASETAGPAAAGPDAAGRAEEPGEDSGNGTDTAAPAAAVEQAEPDQAALDEEPEAGPASQSGSQSGSETKDRSRPGRRKPAHGSRIIRPAGYPRFGRTVPRQPGPSAHPQDQDADAADAMSAIGGPRDFELADDTYFDFGDDDRYIPPPLPPMGRVDPVVAGAWIALFGGPAYLLVSMLTGWQAPRWTALIAVLGFVVGFIVLVLRLGDGPSKRDGPDQGAVV